MAINSYPSGPSSAIVGYAPAILRRASPNASRSAGRSSGSRSTSIGVTTLSRRRAQRTARTGLPKGPVLTLPDRPSLDHLRKQARDLQKEGGLKLASAQRELAKRYGFKDWTALRAHVLGLRLDAAVNDALGGRISPDLSGDDPVFRLLKGDATGIDPHRKLAPRDWPPLLYVAFSRVSTPEARRSAVADLLARGAEPNVHWIHPEYPEPPQTAVAASVWIHFDVEMLRLLLDAGAAPNDGEGMYHGTEQDGHACLRLLIERGASVKGHNALAHMLDREDPEGLALLLDRWGEPEDELHRALHFALTRGRGDGLLRMLVAAGADPEFVMDGVSARTRAVMLGRPGALPGGSPSEAEARVMRAIETGEPTEVPPEFGWAIVAAAGADDVARLERLFAAGFDPDFRGENGKTGLHEAGWHGRANAVRLLLEKGADPNLRDHAHDGTPLNWTVLAASQKKREGHLETIKFLRAAGAKGSDDWLRTLVKDDADLAAAVFD